MSCARALQSRLARLGNERVVRHELSPGRACGGPRPPRSGRGRRRSRPPRAPSAAAARRRSAGGLSAPETARVAHVRRAVHAEDRAHDRPLLRHRPRHEGLHERRAVRHVHLDAPARARARGATPRGCPRAAPARTCSSACTATISLAQPSGSGSSQAGATHSRWCAPGSMSTCRNPRCACGPPPISSFVLPMAEGSSRPTTRLHARGQQPDRPAARAIKVVAAPERERSAAGGGESAERARRNPRGRARNGRSGPACGGSGTPAV